MAERKRLPSWEEKFETQEIPVLILMGDGTIREGDEVYVRQLPFDALGDPDFETLERPNLGRAYFLGGAVIIRDEILKVKRLDTGEDVLPRVRQSFGPGL